MSKFVILSDVSWDGNQHINHYLAEQLSERGHEVLFIDRFFIHNISFKTLYIYITRLLYKVRQLAFWSNYDTYLNQTRSSTLVKVKKILGISEGSKLLQAYLKRCISNQFGDPDFIVSFVPNANAIWLMEEFENATLAYYNTHDFRLFDNFKKTQELEIKLMSICSFVFSDNINVLQDLRKTHRLSNLEKNINPSFTYIPPPVPEAFYNSLVSPVKEFDFCYFGSIDRKFNKEVLIGLVEKNLSVLIIGSDYQPVQSPLIKYQPGVRDPRLLVHQISRSKYILLPYKNDRFSSAVSPGKINQCKALRLPIMLTNKTIAEEFSIKYFDFESDSVEDYINNPSTYQCTENYHSLQSVSVPNICTNILRILNGC